MLRRIRRRHLLILFGGLLVLVAASLTAWAAVAGPVTVLRILRYGDSNIDDFSHYPGRTLQASDEPSEFEMTIGGLNMEPGTLAAFGSNGDLSALLEANDSIAFLVVRDGAILYEQYFQGHSETSLSQLFSVSKSFTSALIGMAIEDGYMEGVEQPVTDLIPELLERGFGVVTLHHLLTMTSGSSYHENDNPFGEHVILNYTPNLEVEILQFTMEREPGELYRYKSGDNALLSLALARALDDEALTAYAQRRLWTPLRMQDQGVWSTDREVDGLERSWCCLATTARDIAKFGALYLNNGLWRGEQLLSADWVEQSTGQSQVPGDLWPGEYQEVGWRGYGYQWWLASEQTGDFFAFGKDGQFVYVNPSEQVVIVRLGRSAGDLRGSQWVRLFQTLARQTGR